MRRAGRYHVVDRAKDAIRRRGENVSSVQVDQEVLDKVKKAELRELERRRRSAK